MLLSSQCKLSVCSVVKTKGIVAKSRINERELKEGGEGDELAFGESLIKVKGKVHALSSEVSKGSKRLDDIGT